MSIRLLAMSLVAASAMAPQVAQLAAFLRNNPQLVGALKSAAGNVASYIKRRRGRRRGKRGARRAAGIISSNAPMPIAKQVKIKTNAGAKAGFNRSRARLTGMEELSVVYGDKSGFSRSFPVSPTFSNVVWLKHMASHFQHYIVKKWKVHYVQRVPTTKEGTLTLAPVYDLEEGQYAVASSGSGSGQRRRGSSWLLQNPDAKQGSVAARLSIDVDVRKFSRGAGSKYRTYQGNTMDESKVPALVRYSCETTDATSSPAQVGIIMVEYDIELVGSRAKGSEVYASIRCDSTDSSDLGLNLSTSEVRGDIAAGDPDLVAHSVHAIGTNTLRFNVAGSFIIQHVWVGTNPAADIDGHLVLDPQGDDVSEQAYSRNETTPGESNYGVNYAFGSSTEYMQQYVVDVAAGDTLTIDTLESGTMTSFLTSIWPWSDDFVPFSTTT